MALASTIVKRKLSVSKFTKDRPMLIGPSIFLQFAYPTFLDERRGRLVGSGN